MTVLLRCLSIKDRTGLNRHEHDAFAEWGTYEPVALIKADGLVVDRVGNDAPRSSNLGSCEAPSQCIGQECRPRASAAPCSIDREASDQEQRDPLRHSAAELCRRERAVLLDGC